MSRMSNSNRPCKTIWQNKTNELAKQKISSQSRLSECHIYLTYIHWSLYSRIWVEFKSTDHWQWNYKYFLMRNARFLFGWRKGECQHNLYGKNFWQFCEKFLQNSPENIGRSFSITQEAVAHGHIMFEGELQFPVFKHYTGKLFTGQMCLNYEGDHASDL